MSGAEPEAESLEIVPLGLDGQPLDVIESLATQLAQADCLEALVALLATCKALRALVVSSQSAWDALSRLRHAFERQPSVDVTAGFPGHDGAYVYTRGAPDDETQRALIGSCVAWCVGMCRCKCAANTRPTIGPLGEHPGLEGGHANFGRLEAARASVLANLRVIECDISALPFKVGMLVLPSNEWLHNPGFGAVRRSPNKISKSPRGLAHDAERPSFRGRLRRCRQCTNRAARSWRAGWSFSRRARGSAS